MSETALLNDGTPPAQTPTGEIKDQGATTLPETKPAPEPAKADPAKPAKADPPSLLNDKKAEPPTGAPEAYTDFTVPEGYTLDPKVAEEASGIFKELGLPQASAQRLVDFYTSKTQEAFDAPFKLFAETQQKWVAEVKADPEIGGKLDQVKTVVSRMLDGLGDEKLTSAFREAMDYTGAGNNPAFIRTLYRLAQRTTEGTLVTGGGNIDVKNPSNRPPSAAQALYPNLPSSR